LTVIADNTQALRYTRETSSICMIRIYSQSYEVLTLALGFLHGQGAVYTTFRPVDRWIQTVLQILDPRCLFIVRTDFYPKKRRLEKKLKSS